jgi:hypothetical protein
MIRNETYFSPRGTTMIRIWVHDLPFYLIFRIYYELNLFKQDYLLIS